MRLDAFLLADHTAVAEGKLYVNGGGVTRLNVPAVPFAIPMLSVFVRYVVEGPQDFGEHTLGLSLVTPSGTNLLPDDPIGTVHVERGAGAVGNEEQALQMSLNFGGIPIVELGVHTLSTSLDGEVTRVMQLPVVPIKGPQQPAAAPNRAERRRQQRSTTRGRRP